MPLLTPDQRYIVVRGRLWRAAGERAGEDAAHRAVEEAKVALAERGPVWWADGAPERGEAM